MKNLDLNNFILISPDAGASKKIYKLAEQIGYKGDIITCSKDRDENEEYVVLTEQSQEDEQRGDLQVIYEDGKFYNQVTLEEVRKRLSNG